VYESQAYVKYVGGHDAEEMSIMQGSDTNFHRILGRKSMCISIAFMADAKRICVGHDAERRPLIGCREARRQMISKRLAR
jgi:hypothetical protein